MMNFPNGAQFAFTIFDDTDFATVENVRPMYDLLFNLKMLTTKSVWVFKNTSAKGHFSGSQTLEDDKYVEFIRLLIKRGFEIGFHNASAGSSDRETTIRALGQFNNLIGYYPRTYTNHHNNLENLYWGSERLDSPLLRALMSIKRKRGDFVGHIEGSPYFWGDICHEHIMYVRNFVFNETDIMKINPTLPYHDVKKKYVKWWFSSADGVDGDRFNRLLSSKNQARLEKEGGVCIVYTHFGKGFVENGAVNGDTKSILEELSKRNGWFVPVATLLDYLREKRKIEECALLERLRMEFTWVFQNILQ